MNHIIINQPTGLEDYHNNLDRLIPLCAGILGQTVYINRPMVKFRRHPQSVSPAGKDAEPKGNTVSRSNMKRDTLLSMQRALCALPTVLQDHRIPAAEHVLSDYKVHIRELNRRLEVRLRLYSKNSPVDKFVELWKATAAGVYNAERNAGFGVKQLLVDAYHMVAQS